MNGHGVTLTSFIVTICNVLYKPARKYFGKLLFGALMRPGTISSRLRGRRRGLGQTLLLSLLSSRSAVFFQLSYYSYSWRSDP